MVRNNITRVHRTDCDCIYEEVTVYDDNNEKILEEPRFLLFNRVCDQHSSMASKSHKPNHAQLSKTVLDIIEEVKARNIRLIDQMVARETDTEVLSDLALGRVGTVKHNEKISKEWAKLTSKEHAFDSHIHEHLRQKDKDKASRV